MDPAGLRDATGWLLAGLGLATLAFALLAFALLDEAIYAGIAASLGLLIGGFRVSSALAELDETQRIAYPYPLDQRGRRLAWTALVSALGLAGYGLGASTIQSLAGLTGLILAGAAALLAPPVALMLVVWTLDGLSLQTGLEEPGDPLVAATASLMLALLLAVLTATTGYGVSFALLVAFGGLVPCLFLLWSLQRIRSALARPLGDPIA